MDIHARMISRRRFLAEAGALASAAFVLPQPRRYKLGLQLYTVRAAMRRDVNGTRSGVVLRRAGAAE